MIDDPSHTAANALCTYPPCPSGPNADPTTTQKVGEAHDTSLRSNGDGHPEEGIADHVAPSHAANVVEVGSIIPEPSLDRLTARQNDVVGQETETGVFEYVAGLAAVTDVTVS